MPLITVDTVDRWTCHYRLEGEDGRPVPMLAHALGLDLGQWEPQIQDFTRHFLVLRYDIRGHGLSDAPAGDYTIEQLGRDALALADALGIRTFAFCGVSLGGMIGQWLAAETGDRVTGVVLANTSPRLTDPSVMETRRRIVQADGMTAVLDAVLERFFTPDRIAANDAAVAVTRRTLAANNPAGYAAACAAVRDLDQTALLARVKVPALVIQSDADVVFGWDDHGRVLSEGIAGARAVRISGGHLGNVEAPRSFTAAVFDFLLPPSGDAWSAGLEVRRATLGRDHVDRSLEKATDFNRDFQQLITRYAWGTIWTRPLFDPGMRRLLVLAMMAVLGRWEEFRMHLRAGLARELEPPDVKEVLLQCAIYGGVPVANTAFHIAAEVLEEEERKRSS